MIKKILWVSAYTVALSLLGTSIYLIATENGSNEAPEDIPLQTEQNVEDIAYLLQIIETLTSENERLQSDKAFLLQFTEREPECATEDLQQMQAVIAHWHNVAQTYYNQNQELQQQLRIVYNDYMDEKSAHTSTPSSNGGIIRVRRRPATHGSRSAYDSIVRHHQGN